MNQLNRLRWGILGAARVNERMMPAIVQASNAELIAVSSRRPDAARQLIGKYAPDQPVRAYDNLDMLLEDPDIQAIYLPLANHEHAQWTLRAIEQGKHVLCEKPMALTLEDIEAIEAAAKRHNVMVMEGFMYRFHPQHARVHELIKSGMIGEIRSVRSSYSFMMRPARMYRLEEDIKNGGGAMWDIGCYAIHSARMFFTESPRAVTATAKFIDSGADIATSGIIDFGDGKYAHFDFSFERARRCEYEIIGTQGGLKCHTVWQLPGDVPVISWWNEDGRQAEERLVAANHFQLEVEHFSNCVLSGNAPSLTLQDAKANCEIINAALTSALSGKRVEL